MCKSIFSPKTPKAVIPAAAPPAPSASAAVAQGDVVRAEENENSVQRSRKKGRNSLRIDLNTSGGTGLNIPQP